MIDAKELMIGCWYYFENIMAGGTEYEQFLNWTQALDFESYGKMIPLTPEILDKCTGFEKDSFGYYSISIHLLEDHHRRLYFAGDYLYMEEKNTSKNFDLITIWNKDIVKEFYLHQLQNLYRSLTGKELEVKL